MGIGGVAPHPSGVIVRVPEDVSFSSTLVPVLPAEVADLPLRLVGGLVGGGGGPGLAAAAAHGDAYLAPVVPPQGGGLLALRGCGEGWSG